MEVEYKQTVAEAKAEIYELTGEHVEDLGLSDRQIQHMLEEGF